MAQSFVQVPPDGAGKLIDTWTTAVAGSHRQAIVIGDPSVDANVIPISSRLRLPVESEQQLDYDTGGGTANLSLVGLGLPASGGPVAGGTTTNPIQVGDAGGSITVDGPLTDAQLRASAVPVSAASLPLPTGAATLAEQQTQTTALQIIDDWDESDRAKVNPIAGQAGVQGGSGTVSALTQRVVLATDVALPAGTALLGKISAGLDTASIYEGAVALTPKFAIIDAATSGDNTLVAANATKKIRVLSLFLVAAGTVNVRFESGAGGTALTGQMNLVANTGFVLPFNPLGWFETAANTLLNLELSGAVSVDGSLTYAEVS